MIRPPDSRRAYPRWNFSPVKGDASFYEVGQGAEAPRPITAHTA